jgi:NADH:ubiquinone oxidoreductase subunit 3 (subunit A)
MLKYEYEMLYLFLALLCVIVDIAIVLTTAASVIVLNIGVMFTFLGACTLACLFVVMAYSCTHTTVRRRHV